jgi:hypothetical protein
VTKSAHAVIGSPSRPNVIYGHDVGVAIEQSPDVLVQSNHVGVTSTGDVDIAAYKGKLPSDLDVKTVKPQAGIELVGSTDAHVTGNTVGGMPEDGIVAHGVTGLELSDNHVGVGANGKADVGNKGSGIAIASAKEPVVGAKLTTGHKLGVSGSGNLFAFNGRYGITATKVIHPRLLSDLLWHNHDGGIDGGADVPASDAPKVGDARNVDGTSDLTVKNREGTKGLLQIYRVTSCSAHPEAETLLRTTDLPAGDDLTVRLKREAVGTHLVATFTTSARGTSAYSACATVAPSQ